jgi:Bacterial cadherin-like domain/Bacterial Ig domain/RTX calcium-binding nonapeptide repeat (4 copies)
MRSLTQAHTRGHRPGWVWVAVVAAVLVTAGGVALASGLGQRGAQDGGVATCRGERATIVGSAGVDRLVGTPRRDVIVAGAGGDVVLGRGGNDVICDREGPDRVIGGTGNDEIGGGSGADRLVAGPGDDWLAGRRGADEMLGGRGNDQLLGERGNDALRGNAGDDTLGGGSGRDNCIGGPGTDVMVDCESGDSGSDVPPSPPPSGQGPGGGGSGGPGVPPSPAPADQAPVAVADAATVDEDGGPQDIPVLTNDTDADGGPKSIASVTQPTDGGVQVTGGGTGLSYEPDADFCNDPPGSSTDDFTYSLAPGGSSASVAITVSCVNDAPVVTTTAGAVDYTEGDPATAVDPGLTVTDVDVDDTNLEGARVALTTGFEAGDELLFTNQNGISGAYNAGTGVLTLTGTSSLANYRTALTSVQYRHIGDNPALTKTVEFRADDGAGLGPAAPRDIAVTAVNDAPTVDTTNAALAYPENAGAVAADAGITLTDPDSAQIQGATVQVTSNFVAAQDELAFANQLGITGSYNDTTGTLTLSGTATVPDYQAALRAVSYENVSNSPSPPTRALTFLATDAEGATSTPATRDITLGAANDAATITTAASALAYTEGDPATAVDGGLTVADSDDTNLEGARVRISAGLDAGDELVFVNQLGIGGVYNTGTGVLTLTGASSVANYQTALRSVAFRTTNDNPTTTKTIEFSSDDGDGLGPPSTRNIDVTRVNDAPSVDTSAGSSSFTEGGGPVAVDPNVTVSDPDSATMSGGTVAIMGGFAAGEDSLGFTAQNGITGSYDPGTGVLTLSGTASVADYQAALRSVTYDNDSDNPSGTRTVSFQVSDGALDSNSDARDVTVTGTNDAPVVTTSAGSTAYTEGDPATAVDAALTVTDPDDMNLDGARVRISAGFDAGDELVFVNQLGISGVYNSGTGVLTLTGTSSVANYQTALRSVAFRATHDNPATAKTVEFSADDGDTDSAPATKEIAVTPVNDAPTITTTAGSLAYTENDGPMAIDGGLTVTDPDSAQLSGATVAISGNHQQAQDHLAFVDQNGITGTYNDGTGVLTLSGTASVADYQTALRSVTYTNISEGPTPLTRTISFQATDAATPGLASNTATRGIAITSLNDPPVAVNDTGTTDEDTTLNVAAPGVLANDTDVDPGDTKTVDRLNGSATLTGTSAKGATVTINANGSYTYNPGSIFQGLSTGQQDTDSFTYRMSDGGGASSTATVNLTITGVSDAPTATADSFEAIGNTALSVGTSRPAGEAGKVITGSVLTNDTDVDTPQANLVAEPVTNASTTLGGSITIEADGNFTYHPDDGDVGVTDTFTYRVCDTTPCNSVTVANSTGTLNLPIAGQVWYVQNNEPAGGDGTSDTPFDTLAEAETASGTGDTVYVFDGNNTSANLDTGFVMQADERLIGEHNGVSLSGHLLHPGTTNAHPTLAATGEDVVVLASGATVDGVNVDPAGAGGGVSGSGAATSNVTINDVNVTDVGTAGAQAGLELNGTGGTNNVSDLSVSTNGAIGVLLNGAGTVNFTPASTITIATTGAKGLDATGTSMGAASSTFDSITVTGSGSGGVSMTNTTGTTTFAGLSLTTTGGTGFLLNNAGAVTVSAAGTANVSATGGPAVDVTGTSGATLAFDNVSSTNSADDGINIAGLGAGTFSAASGTITGAAGIAFDLDGGSGDVMFPGTLTNGQGSTAEITGRTAGTVTLSGPITETGDADATQENGGIAVTGNSGGLTVVSNATKTFSTGEDHAIVMGTSDGHTLTLSGGSLDIDTTSGKGLEATTSGTLNVTGSGNTIDTTTATALTVSNTDIGAAGTTFQRISSTGTGDPAGIVLNSTGSSGGLTVTGTGTAASGGTIANKTGPNITSGSFNTPTGATNGTGVYLNNTRNVSLTRMDLHDFSNFGVFALGVTNFTFASSTVTGANGNDLAQNESAMHFTNVAGAASITGSTVSGGSENNITVENSSATVNPLTISGNTIGPNGISGNAASGNNGVQILGSGSAGVTLNASGNTFNQNKSMALGTIFNDTSTLTADIGGNTFTDNGFAVGLSSDFSADMTFDIHDNPTILRSGTNAIQILAGSNSTADSQLRGRIRNNTIGNATADSGTRDLIGIAIEFNQDPDAVIDVTNNTIRHTDQDGIFIQARDPNTGDGNPATATVDLHLRDNSVQNIDDNTAFPFGAVYGTRVESRHNTSLCLDMASNTSTHVGPNTDFRVRQRDASVFRMERLTDNDGTANGINTSEPNVAAFVTAQNDPGHTSNATLLNGYTVAADGACRDVP